MADASGIYFIINRNTERVYVGSAANLRKRRNSHFSKLAKGLHHSVKLQRSYNKHGVDAFAFMVMEYVGVEQLVEREQYWLNKTKAYAKGYNIQPIAGNSLGVKRSEAFKEKCRQRMLGTTQTIEQRIRRSLDGFNGGNPVTHHTKGVVQLSKDGVVLHSYPSIKEAATAIGTDRSSISAVCKNRPANKTAGGFKWKYAA